jgi:hypothetical protein
VYYKKQVKLYREERREWKSAVNGFSSANDTEGKLVDNQGGKGKGIWTSFIGGHGEV